MFPNLDTCTRNKIHALQALAAFNVGHREYTKASGVPVTGWTLQGPVGCSIGQRNVLNLGHILQKYNTWPTSFGSIYRRSLRIYKGQWGVPVTGWTLQGPVGCSIGRRYVPKLGHILQKYNTCPTSFGSIYHRSLTIYKD